MGDIVIAVRSVDGMVSDGGSPLAGERLHPDVAAAICCDVTRRENETVEKIVFEVPAEEVSREAEVQRVVRAHFAEVAADATRELRRNYRDSFVSLLVAVIAVTALVLVAEGLQTLGEGRMYSLLSESLVIIGWVTLWAPADGLLIAPLGIRRRRRQAAMLARVSVVLRPGLGPG